MEDNKAKNQISIELKEEVAQGTYSNLAVITHSASEFVVDFVRIMPGIRTCRVHQTNRLIELIPKIRKISMHPISSSPRKNRIAANGIIARAPEADSVIVTISSVERFMGNIISRLLPKKNHRINK